jgi:hypothetical protein
MRCSKQRNSALILSLNTILLGNTLKEHIYIRWFRVMRNNIVAINELKMDLEHLRRFHAIGYTGQYPDVVYRAIRHEQERILDKINCLQGL